MTSTRLDQQPQAHARVTREGIATAAATLQVGFGQHLTATIAGITGAGAVGPWARGTHVPGAPAALALEHAVQVVELLRSQEDDVAIRSWFRGMNPDLDERPPALVSHAEPDHVVQAARAFLAR